MASTQGERKFARQQEKHFCFERFLLFFYSIYESFFVNLSDLDHYRQKCNPPFIPTPQFNSFCSNFQPQLFGTEEYT